MPDINYDKIKHFVQVNENILAAFTIHLGKEDYIDDLNLAEDASITKEFINKIRLSLQDIFRDLGTSTDFNKIVGRLRWKIYEFDQIRILLICEKDQVVVVLIKSDTSLCGTVDNILGYYFEAEDIPKSLF